ncbi:MAG: DUF4202 domain-containing protein [Anaerolinea sp.]|nr:DUF4202 domain-containing protein [Anaerolinea sp.]
MDTATRFARAISLIDAANAQDPNVIRYNDEDGPKELIHSELLTRWVKTLLPSASEAVLLAARGQHIRRWMHPRSEYPEGRTGYLRWRTNLYKFHADETANLLREAGYDDGTVTRAGQIIRKEGLGRDPEVQAIEDGLCLVFLETQLDELAGRLDRDKMLAILRKTWKKMSPAARQLALELTFEPGERALISEALAAD